MRASIRTLISTVGLVALLGGCATQEEPLTSDTIPAPLKSTMEGTLPSAILSKALERDGYVLNWSRAQAINTDEFLLTSVPLKHTAGQFIVAEENGSVKFAQVGLFTQNGEVLKNWPVCHRPPGNPKNAHTIYVGEPAVSTHLTKHDDSLGFCGSDAITSEGGYSYAVSRGRANRADRLWHVQQRRRDSAERGGRVGRHRFTRGAFNSKNQLFPKTTIWHNSKQR